MNSTPSMASRPNQNSTLDSRRSRRSLREAMMCQTAWMISAARTDSGRVANSGVRNSSVMTVATQATRFETWVWAPAPSFTAEPDMPPEAIIPPKSELRMFVAPWALSSWSASTS